MALIVSVTTARCLSRISTLLIERLSGRGSMTISSHRCATTFCIRFQPLRRLCVSSFGGLNLSSWHYPLTRRPRRHPRNRHRKTWPRAHLSTGSSTASDRKSRRRQVPRAVRRRFNARVVVCVCLSQPQLQPQPFSLSLSLSPSLS
eukprot:3557516-Rhodomonas_salina.1